MRSKAPSLLPIFRSRHQAELLTMLLLHPDREYTLTEISGRLQTPLTTVQREAGRLVEAGLIRDRQVGRARLLSANPTGRYSTPLTQLVTMAFGPQVVVEEEFGDLEGVDAVAIYGSWAARYHGQAGPAPNDVDVLVLGTPARADVYEAAERAERRIDLPVNPTLSSWQRWTDASDALIQQIKSAPLVWAFGDEQEHGDA